MRESPGPVWGRAASCCLLPRQISGRREACPPARRPRRELRSARLLEARPGPAGLATASNRSGCLCVAWPGPASAHRHRDLAQVLWLAYGSARQAARSSETAIAFACTCMRGIETAIAFAGAKWAFSVQFSGAEVMPVSMVAVWGRALVMVVSRWPASVAVEVSLVASSPHGCVLSAKKFALRGLVVGVCAK